MRYRITISPEDSSGTTTTVVVDTAADASLITDVHLHSATGLTDGRLPEINFGLLLAAVTPAAPASVAIPADASGVPADIEAAPLELTVAKTSEGGDSPAPSEPVIPAEPADAVPTTNRPRRRAGGGRQKSTPATAADTPIQSKTPATPSADADAEAPGEVPVETRGGRQYRRMPTDLRKVYGTSSSVKAVAEHYKVPRHTAQGWIGRLTRSPR